MVIILNSSHGKEREKVRVLEIGGIGALYSLGTKGFLASYYGWVAGEDLGEYLKRTIEEGRETSMTPEEFERKYECASEINPVDDLGAELKKREGLEQMLERERRLYEK